MLRVVMCDDDPASLEKNAVLIDRVRVRHDLSFTLEQFDTSQQLLFACHDASTMPNIAVLDIKMPEMDGFELGRELRRRGFASGALIYVSELDSRTFEAFDVGAFNYVVKREEDEERFERVFLEAYRQQEERTREYLLLNGITERCNIAIDAIRYFEIDKHLCTVHYGRDESFEFVSTLGRLENLLVARGFVRIHRSFMVNCAAVKRYSFKQVLLKDGTELPVGRQRYKPLSEAMLALSSAVAGQADEAE
ncbi:MAG: LytTR family DNA-binding domain-containing protein [Coriobacteriales bacterium]|nr:LytTR family DNA-binding domain-containing protein [Coriobacteriales bacterium]